MKFLVRLALLIALLVTPLYAYKVLQKSDYTDFSVYYKAAGHFTKGELNQVYDLSDGASPFRYVPLTLPFFSIFTALPSQPAQLAWYFIQLLCFGLGFWLLHKTLVGACCRRSSGMPRSNGNNSRALTAFAFLFILRFCLDTFTIGQISSVMFLGYAVALYGWTYRRFAWAGMGLFIPSLLKIGPGFLFALFTSGRTQARTRSLKAAVSLFIGLNLITGLALWMKSQTLTNTLTRFIQLWKDWQLIVVNDSVYYDASHYGSQSLNSFLLRSVKAGWLTAPQTQGIFLSLALTVCIGLIAFWFLRRPKGSLGRVLFFSTGIFPYLWFMPETFKYSLTMLAFPVAALAALAFSRTATGERCQFQLERFVLGFGFLTLSLPGKDIVGDTLFFGLQRASVPFFATVLLGLAVFRQASRHSLPSPLLKTLYSIFSMRRIGPWEKLPEKPTLDISLLVPIRLDASGISPESSVRAENLSNQLLEYARARWGVKAEVLFLPYGNRISELHPIFRATQRALSGQGDSPSKIILPLAGFDGRGYALRRGFLESKGRTLLFFHFEQPCEPEFFDRALNILNQNSSGPALVRANRRLEGTRFKIPVSLLPLVHKRHRFGLSFNRLVRVMLPVQTTDTHSGTLVMTRRLAERVFGLQTSPDFLFDLEISLIAGANHFTETELPVTLYLAQEKSVSRMFHETLHILLGLPFLALRLKHGAYAPQLNLSSSDLFISADDWGISRGVNEGILELIKKGVVRRVSLMADGKFLKHELAALLALQKKGQVSLGLHYNLTYG
ncbi:MAG: hypothetical protein A2070_14735, partial [Bdellovibrionales bacterium GWC1_52_8]